MPNVMDFLNDGGSDLSPPASPVLGYSGSKDLADSGIVFCLNCKGPPRHPLLGDRNFNPESLILRRQLLCALEVLKYLDDSDDFDCLDPSPSESTPSTIFIFGKEWDPFNHEELRQLISLSSKNVCILRNLSGETTTRDQVSCTLKKPRQEHDTPWTLRSDVCRLFNFITSNLRTYIKKEILETRDKRNDCFGKLLCNLGSVKNWPNSVKNHYGFKDGNKCSTARYHLFHLGLEIRWFLLLIHGVDSDVLKAFFAELLDLMWLKFCSDQEIGNGPGDTQPFNCWCVKEIWTMTYLLCQELERPFWQDFEEAILPYSNTNSKTFSPFFCIWVMLHVSTCGEYNISGAYAGSVKTTEQDSINHGYTLVNKILNLWVSKGDYVSNPTYLLIDLIPQWGFNLEVILNFWRSFWLPRIDKYENGVHGLDLMNNVKKWSQIVKSICAHGGMHRSGAEAHKKNVFPDPFFLYLRLLSGHFQEYGVTNKHLKKIRSSIQVPLTKEKVDTLGETALIRIFTLYLTLAFSVSEITDANSILDAMLEIVKHCKSAPINRTKIRLEKKTKMRLITRAFGVAIWVLLNHKQATNMSSTTVVNKFMNDVNTSMTQSSGDSVNKDAIMIYFEVLDNIVYPSTPQFSEKNMGRDALISPNLTMWLTSCDSNYLTRSLRTLQNLSCWIIESTMADRLSSSVSDERNMMTQKIMEKTQGFLISEALKKINRTPKTDLQPLARLAADVTLFHKWHRPSEVINLFDTFAMNNRCSPDVSQFYMERFMEYKDHFENNVLGIPWVPVWIRLNVLDRTIPDPLSEKVLTDKFSYGCTNSELLKELCSIGNCEWSFDETTNIFKPFMDLLKDHSNLDLFNDDGITGNVVKCSSLVLQNMKWAKLYRKGDATCVAAQILNYLVPSLTDLEKKPRGFLNSLKQQLFGVFKCVITCDGLTYDYYLRRKVKETLFFAILGFVVTLHESYPDDHPLVSILQYCKDKNEHSVLKNISDLYSFANGSSVLIQRYVLAVHGLKQSKRISFVLPFLSGIIKIYVLAQTSPELLAACTNIVTYCCTLGNMTTYSNDVKSAFDECLKENFSFKSRQFFELMFSVLRKSLTPDHAKKFIRVHLAPLFEKYVKDCEERRGISCDKFLRTPLAKLLQQISSAH